MDGVSWSASVAQESFSRSRTPAETLSKLANFIARAENKQPRHQRPQQQQQQQKQSQQQQQSQSSHLTEYICQECGSSFSYATDLLHHQDAKHSLPKPHHCLLCGQEFSLRSSLLLHKCEQSATLCAFCHGHLHLSSQCRSQCSMSAPGSSDPAGKLPDSASQQPPLLDGTPYACAPCGRGFSHKQALLQHQQAACGEPPSSSHTVHTSCLPSDSPLLSEGESDSSDAPASPGGGAVCICKLCSRSFGSRSRLQRHRETSHRETRELRETSAREPRETSTREPRETSTREPRETRDKRLPEALAGGPRVNCTADNIEERKRAKCEQKKVLKCRSCDLVCRSVSQLCLHRKEMHSRETSCQREVQGVAARSRRKGTYPCQVCGKILFHHLSLKAHYRQHTAEASRGQCSASSSSRSSLAKRRAKKVQSGLARSKTFRAGPGRPRRRGTRLEEEEKEEEQEEEEEEEQQEKDVEEENGEEEEGCDEVPETEEEEEEEEQEFPCPSCAQVFPLRWQLQEHEELHQSCVRRSRCSVCSCEMDSGKWAGSRRQRRLYHCVPCQQGFAQLHCFLEHCQEHLRLRVEEDTRASKAPDQQPSV